MFCETLLQSLILNQFEVDVLSNKVLDPDLNSIKSDKNCSKYDLIIAYNKKGIKRIKTAENHISILYFCSNINYYKERVSVDYYYKLYIVGGAQLIDDNTYSKIDCLFLEALSLKKNHIVVAVSSNSIINKLTPLINSIISEKFYLISIIEKIININFNPNIKIINDFKRSNELFKEAKIIFGEGQYAIKGILLEKPVLIVGEYGYGGLIRKENIELLFKNGFTGRSGGTKDEYLPINLINNDLDEVKNIPTEELKDIKKICMNLISKQYENLFENIRKCILIKERKYDSLKLWKNDLFSIITNSSSNRYYIRNNITNQYQYELQEDELHFINYFIKESTVYDYFKLYPDKNISNSFIQDMILLKVLIDERLY